MSNFLGEHGQRKETYIHITTSNTWKSFWTKRIRRSREINLNSSKLHKYILTTIDYFTRCTKEILLKNVNDNGVIQSLQQNIITRFGVPNSLVFYNATYLSSLKTVEFALKHNINMKYLANYYSQGNGVAESTNKNLLWITKKTIVERQRD